MAALLRHYHNNLHALSHFSTIQSLDINRRKIMSQNYHKQKENLKYRIFNIRKNYYIWQAKVLDWHIYYSIKIYTFMKLKEQRCFRYPDRIFVKEIDMAPSEGDK